MILIDKNCSYFKYIYPRTIDEGEVRVRAIGAVEGLVLVVIYTDRDDVRWIISARLANRKERALWHA